MNKVQLGDLVGGALQEKFSRAFDRVIENLQNPNTPFKNKRSINIKLTFQQNEARDDVSVVIDVTEKLAPESEMHTSFSVGKDLKTGEIYTEEYGKQIKGQHVFRDVQLEKTAGEIPVDPETGEVLEDQIPKVIDLRKVAY